MPSAPPCAGLADARELRESRAPLRPVSASAGPFADKASARAEPDVPRTATAKSARGLIPAFFAERDEVVKIPEDKAAEPTA